MVFHSAMIMFLNINILFKKANIKAISSDAHKLLVSNCTMLSQKYVNRYI